jgi:tetratricopeptide (TPR) repeat protein
MASNPMLYDYADNDYVQLLVEGGAVGLLLAVTATVLVYWFAGRACLQLKSTRTTSLVLGGLFAWTTLVVQSFFTYGLHVPAITVLATVIAAQLSALRTGQPFPQSKFQQAAEPQRRQRFRRLAPIIGALAALALAFVLVREGWCAAKAERYRLAAEHCKSLSDPAAQERRRTYLHAATGLAPDNALLQLELAEAYHDAFEQHERDSDLKAALQHFVRARDLCPLLGQPHVRLATYARSMARADSRDVYLRRAARLMPDDERIWFVCGARALHDGRLDEAWPCWRRSLECSPRYLKSVVVKSSQHLSPAEVVNKVLPADPTLLYEAALVMGERPDGTAARQTFLAAALRLLEERPGPSTGEACYLRARCHQLLGHNNQALQGYRDALDQAPHKSAWRYEFIQLLCQCGQLEKARSELLDFLRDEPANDSARNLYKTVLAKIAEGE